MMPSPLPMEDQTDEDFFDKLVDDEVDGGGGCEPSFSNDVGSNDEQAFANLSIDEVGASLDGLDDVDRVQGDYSEKGCISNDLVYNGRVEEFDATVAGSPDPGAVDGEVNSDHGVSGKRESDSRVGDNGANASSGPKEVQWSAFNGGTQKASFSDLFNQTGDDFDPFSEVADGSMVATGTMDDVSSNQVTCSSSYSLGQNGDDIQHVLSAEVNKELEDQNCIQYWESLYPGWRYDPNTGQWNQVDASDATVSNMSNSNGYVNPTSDVYYLQHTAQSVGGSMTGESTTGTSLYWNQATYGITEYPAHMVFDPQYPGWYYDTLAQEWRSLESYVSSLHQSTSLDQNQHMSYESPSTANYYPEQNTTFSQGEQLANSSYQLDQQVNWRDSRKDTSGVAQIGKNVQYGNGFISNGAVNYPSDHRTSTVPFSYEQPRQVFESNNGFNRFQGPNVGDSGFQNFASAENTLQSNHHGKNNDQQFSPTSFTAPKKNSFSYEQSRQGFDSSNGFNRFQGTTFGDSGFQNSASPENTLQPNYHCREYDQQFAPTRFNGPKVLNFSQQPHQSSRLSYSSSEGRSPDGRPPHALVSFGFGGKLVVMKLQSILHTQAYANQDSAEGVINIVNLMEVSMMKNDGSDAGFGDCDYIRTLCQQSFAGPLVSGNVGSKELNKWIDDRIANCDIPDTDYRKGEVLKMVLSLLKIACQYYGKLRSAFGADHGSKESDCPESALAMLFSSATRNAAQFSAVSHCLQNMPSEGQIQATAEEVQMLLVSGRRMEALQCAQKGHLWGPAIVIATLLGEQFYGETVKQMALHQLVAGSPLRTLCLLIAGQPAEVFSNSISNNPQTGVGPGCMLHGWEENLAIISANRTKGDELVITHLGDCLWREKGEVMSAHICYLVAEANIEPYSDSARLCLVGADHLKYPRTYASPQAIQITEIYEYAKVLGNSQFVLQPFQPYKLLYACMLAEVGKLSDSLKYCQAVLKSLKTGRSPEVDTWRHMVSSLEERIKIHQQGGYGTNFARAKLVGKLLNFFDNTAHRVVGGLPPPTPSTSHSNGQHYERDQQSRGPRVSTSQSTMVMSSLMTSASADSSDRKSLHNRSMSEPDFGRTPRKDVSPKSGSSSLHDNTSVSGGSSRFGRFGSQIFQKTVGLVLRSRPDRQAKLGETNKFYYDEKLKRWVEEGAESHVEEMTLAPPTTAAFMNVTLDQDKRDESVNAMIHANGEAEYKHTNCNSKVAELPPISSGLNQYSARGRMSVRARYVDTFNKGGGTQSNSFQSPTPSLPANRSAGGNPKFFIPTPVAEEQETESSHFTQQTIFPDDDFATSNGHHSFSSPQMLTPVSTIQRHPSLDKGMGIMRKINSPLPPHSRRTSSWGGNLDMSNHSLMSELRSPGEPPSFHQPT